MCRFYHLREKHFAELTDWQVITRLRYMVKYYQARSGKKGKVDAETVNRAVDGDGVEIPTAEEAFGISTEGLE